MKKKSKGWEARLVASVLEGRRQAKSFLEKVTEINKKKGKRGRI